MIVFLFREAFKAVGRAKSSFTLTLISLTLAVILIEASIIVLQLSEVFQERLKQNITVSLFIKEPFKEENAAQYKNELNNLNYIKSSKYISKDEAADIFVKETGEDFRDILDYNPLPASFNINLNTDVIAKDSLDVIIKKLAELKWVDEVIFRDRLVYRLLSYLDSGKKYLFVITGILILVAVYLVFSTIKLITNNRMQELETMKLVGAKLSIIKFPIILNGLFTGITASAIACLVYYVVSLQLAQFQILENYIQLHKYYYLISLLIIGPVLSFLVTVFALRKVTLKI